jgi:hypothetical protein
LGTTTVAWQISDPNGTAQVYVSQNNGPEHIFSEGPHGTQSASWIQAGNTYEFRLYAGKDHRLLLASTRVTRAQ